MVHEYQHGTWIPACGCLSFVLVNFFDHQPIIVIRVFARFPWMIDATRPVSLPATYNNTHVIEEDRSTIFALMLHHFPGNI